MAIWHHFTYADLLFTYKHRIEMYNIIQPETSHFCYLTESEDLIKNHVNFVNFADSKLAGEFSQILPAPFHFDDGKLSSNEV